VHERDRDIAIGASLAHDILAGILPDRSFCTVLGVTCPGDGKRSHRDNSHFREHGHNGTGASRSELLFDLHQMLLLGAFD
jgi:hypothetical protein